MGGNGLNRGISEIFWACSDPFAPKPCPALSLIDREATAPENAPDWEIVQGLETGPDQETAPVWGEIALVGETDPALETGQAEGTGLGWETVQVSVIVLGVLIVLGVVIVPEGAGQVSGIGQEVVIAPGIGHDRGAEIALGVGIDPIGGRTVPAEAIGPAPEGEIVRIGGKIVLSVPETGLAGRIARDHGITTSTIGQAG